MLTWMLLIVGLTGLIGTEPVAPIGDVTEDDWDRLFAINLRGVFLCMKYIIPIMLKHGAGSILNTSSSAGVIGIKGSRPTRIPTLVSSVSPNVLRSIARSPTSA